MSTLRSQALRLLARREHSRAELGFKLSRLGDAQEVAGLLDELERTGLLSDARTAAAYVRANAARFGEVKLRHTLRSRGIGPEDIDASLAAAHSSEALAGEEARARALWLRKFAAAPQDARARARQARFLQGRGFTGEVVRKVLKAQGGDDCGKCG